jgi:RiboL-PSP-HEPN
MGHFESEAARTFTISSEEIAQLRTIHEKLSGTERGRRDLEVLNKSGIVLLCAIWEAFCEDLADEALHHLLTHLKGHARLPEGLQKRIAKELKEDKNELSPWNLAGNGWKAHLRHRLITLRQQRDREWSNPDAAKVDKFFEDVVGIPKLTDAWHWKPAISAPVARRKLDQIVALRGDIAHRGKTLRYVEKDRVTRALTHVTKLVGVTDAHVSRELKKMTGVEPGAQTSLPKVMVISGK